MVDPTRLLDGPLSGLQRELLQGAQDETPDALASSKLLACITLSVPPAFGEALVGSGGTSNVLHHGRHAPELAKSLSAWPKFAQWGAAIGVASVAGWFLVQRPLEVNAPGACFGPDCMTHQVVESELRLNPVPAKAAPTLPAATPETANGLEAVVSEVNTRDLDPASSAPGATKERRNRGSNGVDSFKRGNGTLSAELRALEPARLALRAKDPERALSVVARYQQQFPNGALQPEAQRLTAAANKLLTEVDAK